MSKKIIIIHRTADFYANELMATFPGAGITSIAEDTRASRHLPAAAEVHQSDAAALITIGRWMQPGCIQLTAY